MASSPAPIELTTLHAHSRRPPPLDPLRLFTTEDEPPPAAGTSTHGYGYDGDDEPAYSYSYEHAQLMGVSPAWRQEIFALLEQAKSSQAAFVLHVFLTFLIIFSALVTVLETVPAVHAVGAHVWFGVETTVVVLFTIEYIGRCLAWSTTWLGLFYWMISFYGVIDLLSVLPYYVELLLQQDTSVYFRFSILRMFRLLRVFRPFRYNHTILLTIEVMYLSVRRSQHALLAIGFFVVMILTVFSTLLYFAERGTWDDTLGTFINTDGDPSQFSSIPAAAWFVLVTITTVGYGEITPRSFLGRLITLPILVFGLLLITLPSFVLGREFSVVWEKMTRDRLEDDPSALRDLGMEVVDSPYTPPAERRRRRAERGELNALPTTPSHPAAASPGEQVNIPGPGIAVGSIPGASMGGGAGGGASAGAYAYPGDGWSAPGAPPPLPPRTPAGGGGGARDLSNLKLAQNQTELSRQIGALRETVESQGRVVLRLLERLDQQREHEGHGRSRGVGASEGWDDRGMGLGSAPPYGTGVRHRGSIDKAPE